MKEHSKMQEPFVIDASVETWKTSFLRLFVNLSNVVIVRPDLSQQKTAAAVMDGVLSVAVVVVVSVAVAVAFVVIVVMNQFVHPPVLLSHDMGIPLH